VTDGTIAVVEAVTLELLRQPLLSFCTLCQQHRNCRADLQNLLVQLRTHSVRQAEKRWHCTQGQAQSHPAQLLFDTFREHASGTFKV
jgi:hypothetical protein